MAEPTSTWPAKQLPFRDQDAVVKWDGTTWAVQPSPFSHHLQGVWGADANNIWAVGYNGAIAKWNGTAWVVQQSGATDTLYGAWGADTSNIWTVGSAGAILHRTK